MVGLPTEGGQAAGWFRAYLGYSLGYKLYQHSQPWYETLLKTLALTLIWQYDIVCSSFFNVEFRGKAQPPCLNSILLGFMKQVHHKYCCHVFCFLPWSLLSIVGSLWSPIPNDRFPSKGCFGCGFGYLTCNGTCVLSCVVAVPLLTRNSDLCPLKHFWKTLFPSQQNRPTPTICQVVHSCTVQKASFLPTSRTERSSFLSSGFSMPISLSEELEGISNGTAWSVELPML